MFISVKKQLQFYADLKNSYSNRLFSFSVTNNYDVFRILYRFSKNGNVFRKIYLNVSEDFGVSKILSSSFPLPYLVDLFNNSEFDNLNDFIIEYKNLRGYPTTKLNELTL